MSDQEHPLDVCECGDYRQQHEGGKGRCKLGSLCTPTPCQKFRFFRSPNEMEFKRGAEKSDIVQSLKDHAALLRKMDASANAERPTQTHEATAALLERAAKIILLYQAYEPHRRPLAQTGSILRRGQAGGSQ